MFTETKLKCLLSAALLLSTAPLTMSAEETHLDIKVPQRIENDLFGPVKKVVTEYSYNLSDRNYKEELLYDEAGNLLSKTKWNSKNEVSRFETNRYNEVGCHIINRIENVRSGSTNEYEVIINVPSRKIAFRNKDSGSVEIREYSPEKYHLTSKRVDKQKKPMSSSLFKRRPDNKEKQYISYDDRRRIKFTVAIDWDDDTKLQSRELIDDRKKKTKLLNEFEHLSIDKHGNWTQRLTQAYNIDGADKEKAYEKFSTRTIEYFDE